jgi:hypothetical protein
MQPGRPPHYPFRGLLSVHSRYGLHARQITYVTLYIGGPNCFVASTAAPIATGWNDSCRMGISPIEETRLSTAHCIIRAEHAGENDQFSNKRRFSEERRSSYGMRPAPHRVPLRPSRVDKGHDLASAHVLSRRVKKEMADLSKRMRVLQKLKSELEALLSK